MTFNENNVNREADGKFGEKTGSAATVELPTRPAPLKRLSLQSMNWTIMHYTMKRDGGDRFLLDAPYQRDSVWTEEKRQALIRSMLMGLPVGSVTLNKRSYDHEQDIAVIDGKQRIETLRAWENDELEVPRHWFEEKWLEEPDSDEPMVSYSGLSVIGHRFWGNMMLPAQEARVNTIAEEAEIYNLINRGGVDQTDEDMANAQSYESDETVVQDARYI